MDEDATMTWRESVIEALARRSHKTAKQVITRQELIDYELPRIRRETGSTGATPEQTLSRTLQELRDAGIIEFDAPGEYRLL